MIEEKIKDEKEDQEEILRRTFYLNQLRKKKKKKKEKREKEEKEEG